MNTASAFVPLWDRRAEWTRRLAMIRGARTFLYVSTFYVEYDAYAVEFLDALDDALRRGVTVNLLIDGFGQQLGGVVMTPASRAALDARLDRLRRTGAIVTFYRPRHWLQQWLGGGHHVKIQVSDAGEAIFGSSNITHASFEGWNEYSVAVRGAIVVTLLQSYRDIGGVVDIAHVAHLQSIAAHSPATIALDYWFSNPNLHQGITGPLGWRGPNLVTDMLVAMIASAQRSIRITSFYFKPVEALMAALMAAAERGVEIEIHHSHRDALPATELAWIAAAAHYPRLLAAGVSLYENRHGEHSKIVLVDDNYVAFGSYNFEHAAHDRLAEAMLATRDVAAVEPALGIFDELRQHPDNVLVTSQWQSALSTRLRLKRAILSPFKRWM